MLTLPNRIILIICRSVGAGTGVSVYLCVSRIVCRLLNGGLRFPHRPTGGGSCLVSYAFSKTIITNPFGIVSVDAAAAAAAVY